MWGRGQNLRRLLVIAELALSVMLLIGAGLLIRSFWRLQQVSPGFNADRVLTLELTMTGPRYAESERVLATYRDLWSRLTAIPGATARGRRVDAAAQPDVRVGTDRPRRTRAAVGRDLRQRRSARGRRPVLRGDADSADPRTALHRARHQGRASRRRHRRSHGAGAVAERGSDRQAAASRRHGCRPTMRRG